MKATLSMLGVAGVLILALVWLFSSPLTFIGFCALLWVVNTAAKGH